MSELTSLYQEVILDHNRQPRNFRKMEGATRKAEGYNPLCGDRVTVYLKLNGDCIEDISFEGSGCAISKASSSLMTSAVKGKTLQETDSLYDHFHEMVTGKKVTQDLGKLSVFAGVAEFPARVKCATLVWHTMRAALQGKDEPVSTEEEKVDSEGPGSSDLREKVIEALKSCYDPEIPVNIYEMGLIYEMDLDEQGGIKIRMTLTSPACPVATSLPPEVEEKARRVPGITSAKVEVVWDPPWKPEMMSEAARLQLGIM